MNYQFQRRLFFIMLALALTISFTIAIIDHIRLKEQSYYYHEKELAQIEDHVKLSIEAIEKSLHFFDKDTAKKMEENTLSLIEKYKQNPQLDDWDFAQLKEQFGMDIYMINEDNVITHSSFESDIGLNFNECCQKLAKTLDFRREAGTFFHDGLDIEQKTGNIKKYSFMATPDKKYLIELGYSLQEDEIFHQYNFLETIEQLVEKHDTINDINVYNFGGLAYGKPATEKLTGKRRDAFREALITKRTVEVREGEVIYRYVSFESNYDPSPTKNKVIEIAYNDDHLQSVLSKNSTFLSIELAIVFLFTFIVSLLISKLVAKPIYYAFHDSLTNLKNRTALNEIAKSYFETKRQVALLMIDLDDFKLVNDTLGHDEGDHLLKRIGQQLLAISRRKGEAFRLGGDEFVVLLPFEQTKEIGRVACEIINSIRKLSERYYKVRGIDITLSMGIAFAPNHGEDIDTLYKRADVALYAAKEKGKNQFAFYDEDDLKSFKCSS